MSQFLWTLDAEPQLDITRPAHRHVYCGRCPCSSHDILLAASWRSANNADSISLSMRTFSETIYILAKPLWSFAPWNSARFKQYVCTRFRISKYQQPRNACSTLYYMIKFQTASTAVLQYFYDAAASVHMHHTTMVLQSKQQTFSFNDLQLVIIYVPADWVCGCGISRGFLEGLQQLERGS